MRRALSIIILSIMLLPLSGSAEQNPILAEIVAALKAGNKNVAFAWFNVTDASREVFESATPSQMKRLAHAIEQIDDRTDCKFVTKEVSTCTVPWINKDKTVTPLEIALSKNHTGHWIILSP